MPRLEDPRSQILTVAQQLIQKNSFKAVRFQDIANVLKIKKASIYYHFNSKDALGLEVIKKYRLQIQEQIRLLEDQTSDPSAKLRNYFRFFANIHRTTVGMCPAGVLACDVSSISDEMRVELKEFFYENFKWLVRFLEEGKASKQFKFNGSAETKALSLESVIQGGLLYARMLNDSQVFWNVLKQQKDDLEISESWTITPRDANGNQIVI